MFVLFSLNFVLLNIVGVVVVVVVMVTSFDRIGILFLDSIYTCL